MKTGWDIDTLTKILNVPKPPKQRYIVTDDRDEFIGTLERITELGFKSRGDNLKYLENLEGLKRIKAGADIEDVFPWVKECNSL